MLVKNFGLLIVGVLHFVHIAQCLTKIWKHTSNIMDPKNWVDNAEDCSGFKFAEYNSAPIFIDKISAESIELPIDGELVFNDGSNIEIDPDNKNCTTIGQIQYQCFVDYNFWETVGEKANNTAIPHAERIPCHNDDIIFPNGIYSAVDLDCLDGPTIYVHSLKFGDNEMHIIDFMVYLVHNDDGTFLKNKFINNIFGWDQLRIESKKCKSQYGCVCDAPTDSICDFAPVEEAVECLNPILPTGFCKEICGASMSLKYKKDFSIARVQQALDSIKDLDTHVSRISNDSGDYLQVVIREKEFTGMSLDVARSLQSELLKDEYQVKSAELYLSGPFYIEGQSTGSAFSIVFGTLLGVVMFFGVIFFMFSRERRGLHFINSISQRMDGFGTNSRPISSLRSYVFTRRDSGGEGLIFEGQSIAGSVISLDKSFDNPMYGKATPSTSTSNDTISRTPEEKVSKVESVHENPLYDIMNISQEDIKQEEVED